jgi:formylglycine-generating enzyme required for sulfatase activity
MISAQTLRVCREGKPVSTFPDHALGLVRTLLLSALAVLGVVLHSAPAVAEKRIALVIGNSAYQHVAPLRNPRNDATLIAETLRGLGFGLVGGRAQLDLDKRGVDAAVQDFGKLLEGADVGLFYYAGHGVQVRGANYLVPTGADPTKEADVDFQMLDTTLVLRQMESAGTKLNLVILDACRNNPFGGRGLRGTDSGLAQMRAPEGTLISFATQPGNVSLDGADGNSPYTKALAHIIRRPGLDVFRVFNEVGLAVMQATGNAQQPWVSTSPIKGEFYFAAAPAASASPADEVLWNTIKDSDVVALFEEFRRRFPSSGHAGEALVLIERLKKSGVAVVAPSGTIAVPGSAVESAAIAPPQPLAAPCGGATLASVASRPAQPLSAGEECALAPKTIFKECAECPEMVVVPAGAFTMGSPASEAGRQDFESPEHTVTFSRPFAVGKFHVTVDEFAAFVTATGYDAGSECWDLKDELSRQSWRNPGYHQNGKYPVACVSWEDANAYVAWLAQRTGKPYRLLSEAEWEYAARARTTPGPAPRYFFGDDEREMCRYGNGVDQTMKSYLKKRGPVDNIPFLSCSDGYTFASPVGSLLPNVFGLYDMHGNVWQWTDDCFHDSYRDAPTHGSAWTMGDCNRRILRGGSWSSPALALRSAVRDWNSSDHRYMTYGFRAARTLAP